MVKQIGGDNFSQMPFAPTYSGPSWICVSFNDLLFNNAKSRSNDKAIKFLRDSNI